MSWISGTLAVGAEFSGGGLNLVLLARRWRRFEVVDWLRVDDVDSARPGQVAEWLARNRAAAAPVMVCLPRAGVLVRFLDLPAAAESQLSRVVGYQMDALHPFGAEEVAWDCAVVSRTAVKTGQIRVLVAVAEKTRLETCRQVLAREGLRPEALTLAAMTLAPLLSPVLPPAAMVVCGKGNTVELLGIERGALCATREVAAEPAADAVDRFVREMHGLRARFSGAGAGEPALFACGAIPEVFSELAGEAGRLPALQVSIETPRRFELGAQLGAVSAACAALTRRSRHSSTAINLIPEAERVRPARGARVPLYALGATTAALALVATSHGWLEGRLYARSLEQQIRRLEPAANEARKRGLQVSTEEGRMELLDSVRRQTWRKLELLAELTRILPDGTWVQDLQMTEDTVELAGYSDRAAELIQTLENSPLLAQVEFTSPITRDSQNKEVIRIRMRVENPQAPNAPTRGEGQRP